MASTPFVLCGSFDFVTAHSKILLPGTCAVQWRLKLVNIVFKALILRAHQPQCSKISLVQV